MFTAPSNGPMARSERDGGRWKSVRTIRRFLPVAILLTLVVPAAARADSEFGIVPGSFTVHAENRDGTVDQLAGSHPYAYTLAFNLEKDAEANVKGGNPRDVIADLPPGFLGNPLAAPRCTRAQFEGFFSNCPAETAIGVVEAVFAHGGDQVTLPLFNLVPPPGVAAQLGTSGAGLDVLQSASVNSEDDYRIEVGDYGLPTPVSSISETIWGVPAEASHDAERTLNAIDQQGPPVPSNAPPTPFLTMPDDCDAPLQTTLRIDSQLTPGAYAEASLLSTDPAGDPAALVGCENVPFAPLVGAAPTSLSAESASGLHFHLQLPNSGLLSPEAITETEPEKTEVTLPQGVTVNPSAANGLSACTPAQYQAATAESRPGQGCPESSKIGTLVANTPLLEEAIEGSVYLAAPHDNPFGSLLALYIVAKAPQRGVLIKQAGEVRADPSTGQLTTTFGGLPPLPYSSFEFDLREGPRAPLVTPQACGTYQTVTKLYPFSAATTPTERTASFTIGSGANGGACVASEGQLPNAPSLQAGTAAPVAGAFSPLTFEVSREDGTQHLSSITANLPPGLLAKLAGIPHCSEAQIAAAAARSREGEGAAELSAPSCPEASQVGIVNVTVGAGSQPYAVQGKVYLAGAYQGAPLSLAVITPAIAGPIDLGTVVVRVALYIDPSTAQVRAVSGPIPTILDGIPLQVRSVALNMNRPEFTLNPTSCEAKTIGGEVLSTSNQVAQLSNRFQVGGCQGLPFSPSFAATTAGNSNFRSAPLDVKIAQKSGEPAIRKVDTQLPLALPSRLVTLQKACVQAQFAANPAGCPAGSVVGTATANTPILNVPLTGPAYLVSHGGAAFPDLDLVLQGEGITIDLVGNTDIKKGITYSRFETVPDAPISAFELKLPGGTGALLAATKNLCAPTKTVTASRKVTKRVHGRNKRVTVKVKQTVAEPLLMPTTITGQNGAVVKQSTKIAVTGCAKAKTKAKKKKKSKAKTKPGKSKAKAGRKAGSGR
jgi:hypothetical protein